MFLTRVFVYMIGTDFLFATMASGSQQVEEGKVEM